MAGSTRRGGTKRRTDGGASAVATLAAAAALACGCSAGSGGAEQAGAPPETGPAAELHAFLLEAMALDAAPGLAVAVVRDDQLDYVQGFGSADLARGTPVDASTIFYIASATKSFTGTAAAVLDERGRIDLDAPLSAYLPGIELTPPSSADSITLRALLTHTHGLDNGGPIVLRTAFTGIHDPDLLLELLERQPAGAQGREFEYGNLGYNVASLALDAETGRSWKDLLDELIFEPLGMRSTSAYMSEADPERLARPYGWSTEGWEPLPYAKADANMHAAGGMITSAADLSQWLIANLNSGRIGDRQVLPAAAIEEAQTAFADNDDAWGPFSREAYGLGWHVGHYEGVPQIHHFGGFPGFHAHVSMMPGERIGVAVLVNDSFLGSDLATAVAAFAYDAYLGRDDLADRRTELLDGLSGSLAEGRAAITRDRERRADRPQELSRPLEAYAGTYRNEALGTVTWSLRDGRLHAEMGLAESGVEVYDAAEDQLRVELTGGGTVASFDFHAGGPEAAALEMFGYRFERVD